jgi:hypothetical protein
MTTQKDVESNTPSMPRTEDKALWNIISGIRGYPALIIAHELKLFPLLHKAPHTLPEIAKALNIAERPAEAIVFTNVALGMLERVGQHYALSMLAEDYLLEESPTYFGGVLDLIAKHGFTSSIQSLKQAVLTNAAQTYGGTEVFKSHEQRTEDAKTFTRAMHGISVAPALTWPLHIDLSQHHCMLDIGGGSGAHSIGALRHWPQLNAIVFDITPVCEVTKDFIKKHQLETRMHTCVGDIWESAYPPADVHFYSQIYHDWPPSKCQFLTNKSFNSLPSGGKIVIHEILYNDDKTGPFRAAAASISMLLWTEGQQFSGQELTAMLAESGFINITVETMPNDWSIVIGQKP